MAGVFEQLRTPRKQLIGRNASMPGLNPKVLQLQVAKEILAEVFGIDISNVEEMLKQRYEERSWAMDQRSPEALWPLEFCLAE